MNTTIELRIDTTRPNERGWMSENYLLSGTGKSVFS